ncbi:biopolymer transporter ExbD [Brevundimonas sp.]|uniref:biopolymer transporter ExbD n=1 Tax=Brevundimonas sp. TaxID=1871086 RepID=UPI00391B0FB5
MAPAKGAPRVDSFPRDEEFRFREHSSPPDRFTSAAADAKTLSETHSSSPALLFHRGPDRRYLRMAAKLKQQGGKVEELNSDMNVTPFVDVMLVLLIIFMVAAPLATVSIRLDLPPASPPAPGEELKEPVFISIQDETSLYVVDEQTTLENLIPALNAALNVPNPREERVFVRANPEVTYERFMEVMNTLQANAFYKVGLLNEDIE